MKKIIYTLVGIIIFNLNGCSEAKKALMPKCNDNKVEKFIRNSLQQTSLIIRGMPISSKLKVKNINGFYEKSYIKSLNKRVCSANGEIDGEKIKIEYSIKPANKIGNYLISIEQIDIHGMKIKTTSH